MLVLNVLKLNKKICSKDFNFRAFFPSFFFWRNIIKGMFTNLSFESGEDLGTNDGYQEEKRLSNYK